MPKMLQPKPPDKNGSSLKIAIACPGIGLAQRGAERYFLDLFNLVKNDIDITLFKGAGTANQNEVVLRFTSRNGLFLKLFPVHRLVGRTSLHSECLTFALALISHLRRNQFDVVHCIDPSLTRILFKLRYHLGMKFRLLHSEGSAMPPEDYPPADHMHQVSEAPFLRAVEYGHAPSDMTMLPCGLYPGYFKVEKTKAEIRSAYGVDAETFVILCVAALNKNHKRLDHLIEEAADLDEDILVYLDGSMDQGDPEVVDLARKRLGDRCRISQVASDRVGELYKMADVLVHPAIHESFGLTIIEAASTGLPVLIHDNPHFRWLIPRPESWLDMCEKGLLTKRLKYLINHRQALTNLACPQETKQRFDWNNLKDQYLGIYQDMPGRPIQLTDISIDLLGKKKSPPAQ